MHAILNTSMTSVLSKLARPSTGSHLGNVGKKAVTTLSFRGLASSSLSDEHSRWMHGLSSVPLKLAPLDMGVPLKVMGQKILERHFPKEIVTQALGLLTEANTSVRAASLEEEIHAVVSMRENLKSLPAEKFKDLINVLYVYTKLDHLDAQFKQSAKPTTPLRDAMRTLLASMSISDAIACVPKVLTDVFTTHPVKGDSGAVVGLSWTLADVYQEWQQGVETYRYANDDAKPRLCEDLNRLREQMLECIVCLCTTDPVPTVRILPEDEQQNISVLVKKNEDQLLKALHRARRIILSSFFEKMATDIAGKDPALGQDLLSLLQLPPEERLSALKKHPQIQSHPDYDAVIRASESLGYMIEKWLFDMDGHPLVNQYTGTRAMALGRVLAFGELTEEQALVKFSDKAVPTEALVTMTRRLQDVERDPTWGPYVKSKLKMGWPVVKIYSGLVYFRIRDAVTSAEKFQHEPNAPFTLMKKGIPHSRGFETLVAPLAASEKALDIQGFWSRQLDLVRLRGVELGAPHIRIGESFFAKLLSNTFHILFPETHGTPKSFLSLPIGEQKNILSQFVSGPRPDLPLGFDAKLDAASSELYTKLRDILSVSAFATIIASDSAGEHGDAECSILVLKAISKLMGHRGDCYPLFEDKRAMESAIDLLHDKTIPDSFFAGVGVQTAGSDNQKREGPFLSARLNYAFLDAARERGVPSFFGRGCSPFRSATSDFPFDMVTVQPGQLHQEFNTARVLPYLMSRVAKQISAETQRRTVSVDTNVHNQRVLGTIAHAVHDSLRESLSDYPEIRAAADRFAGIQTNFHSRPPKKADPSAEKTDLLMTMRAIGLAKFQMVASTVDPQMAGALAGVRHGISELSATGVSLGDIQAVYRGTHEGQAILDTLVYFHDLLDPAIPDGGIRKTTNTDIAEMYQLLAGQNIPARKTDPVLRLARCLFREAPPAALQDTLLLLPAV